MSIINNNDPVPVPHRLTRRGFLELGALTAGAAALSAFAPRGSGPQLLQTPTPFPTETVQPDLTGLLEMDGITYRIDQLAGYFTSPTSIRNLCEPKLPNAEDYSLTDKNERLDYEMGVAKAFFDIPQLGRLNYIWVGPGGADNQIISSFPGYDVDGLGIDVIANALKNEYGPNYIERNHLFVFSEDCQWGGVNPGNPTHSRAFTDIHVIEGVEKAFSFAAINPGIPAEVIWAFATELAQGHRDFTLDNGQNFEVNANSFGWAAVAAYLGYNWNDYNARIPGSRLYHIDGTYIDLVPVSESTYSQLTLLNGKGLLIPRLPAKHILKPIKCD